MAFAEIRKSLFSPLDFWRKSVYTVITMEILSFTAQDFSALYDFMRPLWLETYANILPAEQIDFLLNKYFSEKGLAEYRANGYEYFKLTEQEKTVGVLVFIQREQDVFMDKLYLLPCARGKNYPAQAFAFMARRNPTVTLNVNQANARALRCYQKNGFKQIEEKEILLENGMINRDFVMQKTVTLS